MMEIRPLKTKDIFTLSRVLRKMGLKPTEAKDPSKLGIELMTQLLTGLGEAEGEASDWLASLVGMTPAEFAEADIEVALEAIRQLLGAKKIRDFFQLR